MDKTSAMGVLLDNHTINHDTGCWIWNGGKDGRGYGAVPKLKVKAHRLSAAVFLDFDLTSSLCVLHRCDTPACINPSHLFIGTQKDNIEDCRVKGRMGTKKLEWEQVREIRRLYRKGSKDFSLKALGAQFSIDPKTVHQIVTGKTWRMGSNA